MEQGQVVWWGKTIDPEKEKELFYDYNNNDSKYGRFNLIWKLVNMFITLRKDHFQNYKYKKHTITDFLRSIVDSIHKSK